MANCPTCHAEIKDDFGLVTCSACGAQVMVEFDGSVATPEVVPSLPDEFVPEPAAPVEVSEPPPVSPDMREIADFGNSTVSQGREGLLRFDLYLTGIDTADIRNQVRESLADGRFLWDADQLMSEVKNGALKIKEVTAVKSALLVQRLRSVPVEIRWEQYAIHQS